MRRTLAAVLVAATAVLGTATFSGTANAVCGGGQPGEPCYCPHIKYIPFYC